MQADVAAGGERDPARWWPARCFAAVGDALAADGWTVVLTGSAAEHGLAEAVRGGMRAPAINAACDIPIGALAALLSRAAVLVCNDTGVAHVAAGLGLPSVVVFLASDPRRWAALDRSRHVALGGRGAVSAADALAATRRLLQGRTAALHV